MISWADILDIDTTGLEQVVEQMEETGEELERVAEAIDAHHQLETELFTEMCEGIAEMKEAIEL